MPHKLLPFTFALILIGMAFSHSPLKASPAPYGQWQSKIQRDHPLTGKIWSVSQNRFVSLDSVITRLAAADFVLLGEIHDNLDHHLLQAMIVDRLARLSSSRLALIFEMIPTSYTNKLKAYRMASPDNTEDLGAALDWNKRGWPDWKYYQPIAKVAFTHNLPIIAGDLPRKLQRSIARKGKSILSAIKQQQLFLNINYTKDQKASLDEVLFESHCKLMPKKAMAPMRLIQQARDGSMAAAMLAHRGKSILIAGAGHTRRDLAVPRILKAVNNKATIKSLSFMEVVKDKNQPGDYYPKSTSGNPVFDYVFFTPRGNNKDHCAELAKKFGKPKKQGQ